MPLTPQDIYNTRLNDVDREFISRVETELLNKCAGTGHNSLEDSIQCGVQYSEHSQFVFVHCMDDYKNAVASLRTDECVFMPSVRNYFLSLGWKFQYRYESPQLPEPAKITLKFEYCCKSPQFSELAKITGFELKHTFHC